MQSTKFQKVFVENLRNIITFDLTYKSTSVVEKILWALVGLRYILTIFSIFFLRLKKYTNQLFASKSQCWTNFCRDLYNVYYININIHKYFFINNYLAVLYGPVFLSTNNFEHGKKILNLSLKEMWNCLNWIIQL